EDTVSRSFLRERKYLAIESDLLLERADDGLRPPEAVAFRRERGVRDPDATPPERARHGISLARWHDAVVEPLEEDDGAADAVHREQGRASEVEIAAFQIRTDETLVIV